MINKNELMYKIDAVIEYLKSNGGYDYKLYNHICPNIVEPDSNIVEYAEDIKDLCIELIKYNYSNEKEDILIDLISN